MRGLGIVDRPTIASIPVALFVEAGIPDRLPEPATRTLAGIAIPAYRLALLEASAPAKIDLMLDRILR